MKLSILSWNLLEGCLFPHAEGETPKIDSKKLKSAQELISYINPDILILNEALYCKEYNGYHQNYAELFDYPYFHSEIYDKSWGNIILSKYHFDDIMNQKIHLNGDQNRGFIAIKTKGIWISTYHPHPHRKPHKRGEDFYAFLSMMNGPALLMGDLNAINPQDNPDRDLLIKGFEKFSKDQEQAIQSVDRFLESGKNLFEEILPALKWKDGFNPLFKDFTIPTALIRQSDESNMRIDHLLVNSEVKVNSSYVIKTSQTDIASDHYPILAEIKIN